MMQDNANSAEKQYCSQWPPCDLFKMLQRVLQSALAQDTVVLLKTLDTLISVTSSSYVVLFSHLFDVCTQASLWGARLFLPSGVCDDLSLHSSASAAPHYPPAWRIGSAPLIGPAPPVSGSDRVTCFLALPSLRLPPGSPGAFGNVLVWSWAVEPSPRRRL